MDPEFLVFFFSRLRIYLLVDCTSMKYADKRSAPDLDSRIPIPNRPWGIVTSRNEPLVSPSSRTALLLRRFQVPAKAAMLNPYLYNFNGSYQQAGIQ